MKKFILIFIVFIAVNSCKTNTIEQNPETLPKDISEKPTGIFAQKQDSENLQQLKSQIDELIGKTSCNKKNDWKISPIGTKPCGGPTSYIAYPIVKEAEILPKIKEYTLMQDHFNKKYQIISDCVVEKIPTGIKCEKGKPTLMYDGTNTQ